MKDQTDGKEDFNEEELDTDGKILEDTEEEIEEVTTAMTIMIAEETEGTWTEIGEEIRVTNIATRI